MLLSQVHHNDQFLTHYHNINHYIQIIQNKMKKGLSYYSSNTSPIRKTSTFYQFSPQTKQKRSQSQTMNLTQLKMSLIQYLRDKQIQQHDHRMKHYNFGATKLNMHKLRESNQDIKKIHNSKIHHILQSRLAKKQQQKRQSQELKKMYKKSFTIKEIKPKEKHRNIKESFLPKDIEKAFGSYYQIVALQKKFDKSQYCSKQVMHSILEANPELLTFKNRYDNEINPSKWRPRKTKKKASHWPQSFDGQVLQPWESKEENLIDF